MVGLERLISLVIYFPFGRFGGSEKRRLLIGCLVTLLPVLLKHIRHGYDGPADVLWHDGDTLGVDGAEVGVLEETDEVSLAGLAGHVQCQCVIDGCMHR